MEWNISGGLWVPLTLVVVALGAFLAYLRFDTKTRHGPQGHGVDILAFFFAPLIALTVLLLLDLVCLVLMPVYLLYRAARRFVAGPAPVTPEATESF